MDRSVKFMEMLVEGWVYSSTDSSPCDPQRVHRLPFDNDLHVYSLNGQLYDKTFRLGRPLGSTYVYGDHARSISLVVGSVAGETPRTQHGVVAHTQYSL